MPTIVLNLKNLNPTETADRIREIAAALTSNSANFPTPSPSVTELTAAATLIDSKESTAGVKDQEATAARSQRDTAVTAGVALLQSLVNWTEDHVPADQWEEVFTLKKAPTPTTQMGPVLSLAVTFGDNAGELDCVWQPVAKAKAYEIQIRYPNQPSPAWVHGKIASASRATLTGLPSAQTVQIRVRAIGPNDLEGAFSDLAEHLVP